MKITRLLFGGFLTLLLVLSLCAGTARPALAANPDMSDIYDRLSTAFGLTQSDYDNYEKDYAASLPIEYERKDNSYYSAVGGTTSYYVYTERGADTTTGKTYPGKVTSRLNIPKLNNDAAGYEITPAKAVSHIRSYSKHIVSADLITFQLDAAPFLKSCMDNYQNKTAVVWSTYLSDPALIDSIKTFKADMIAEYSTEYGKENATTIATILENLLFEHVAYCFETMNVVREIRKYNDSAVVLVLGLYNPLQNLRFSSGSSEINVSDLMDQMIDICNTYLLKHTRGLKNTAFVDVSDTTTYGCNLVLNVNDDNFVYDFNNKILNSPKSQYANQAGHDYICNQIVSALKAPCKHTNTTLKNAAPASCKAEGYTGDTVCSDCGKVMSTGSSIPKTSHSYGAWTQTKAPSCTVPGTKTQTCTASGCGDKKTESIPATGHSYDSRSSVTTKPGCESEGVRTFPCTASGCNATRTESIPATGHSYDNGTVTTKPGCESEGVKTSTCSGCKKTRTESIPATGHSYNSGTVTTKPGCESEGVKTFSCSGCKKTKTEAVPATGHSYDNGSVTTKPGCESEGVKTFTCSGCKKTKTEVISATGHSYDEGTVTTKPGCESEGEKMVTCTTCGASTTETIPPTGHFYDDGIVTLKPGCESEGEKTVTCTACGTSTTETISPTGHFFGDYISNGDATCEHDGTKTAVCENCHATDTVDDPGSKKEHDYQKGVCISCGAEKPSNSTIWWALSGIAGVAAAGGGTVFFLKYKKKTTIEE